MTASSDVHGNRPAATSTALRLRPVRPDDEPAFAAAHRVMAADGVTFGHGYEPGLAWSEYLRILADNRAGVNVPSDRSCVLPRHRRRGHATEILRQSLVIARATGVDRVLVTCNDGNIGSAAVIEACGGRLDSVVRTGPGASPIRRYWIA